MEQREDNAVEKATMLISHWDHAFRQVTYTLHPEGLPGEACGKSSNESWAAKQLCSDYPIGSRQQDVIVTVLDGRDLSLIFGAEKHSIFTSRHPRLSSLFFSDLSLLFGIGRHES